MVKHATNKNILSPKTLFNSHNWGFSQGRRIKVGNVDMIHISGQVPWDEKSTLVANDLPSQFSACLDNVITVVKEAGGTKNDIQQLRIYVVNFKSGKDAEVIAKILKMKFKDADFPASTWLGVESLAQPDYLVEVDAIATIINKE
ncbi:RidA family protein [Facilibium subflavum]|uniref:RidA family protein n=1 Tax=Facilibium subflavum TaxID=2219058 RepID=UPI000E65D1F7|nr:RidA family protein [Facilibium subflavum]